MADFKAITIDGTSYTVKDETARTQSSQAQSTANAAQTAAGQALSKATTNENDITELANEGLAVSYVSESESIQFTKGIVIGG